MLVLVLQMLDLLGESGKILAYPGNGEASCGPMSSLRVPQLIARFLPYSVLLATIITLATLNQNSEVISMKAAGLSAHQVLAPLLLTAAVASRCSASPSTSASSPAPPPRSRPGRQAEYGPIPQDSAMRSNVYLRDGANILLASDAVRAQARRW